MREVIILIPSRLKSRRLKNKPLLKIDGLPLVLHTYKRASMSKLASRIYVCTDSKVIEKECKKFSSSVVMTSSKHKNGTERIAEAAKKLKLKDEDIIVDVQGDEPLIDPKQIDRAVNFFKKKKFEIILPNILMKNANSKNIVKLVFDKENKVRWMSRSEIPHNFNSKNNMYYKHLSIIVFTKKSLIKYSKLKQSKNEKIESIELLRALENDMSLGTFTIKSDSFSVDVLEDYLKAQRYFKNDKIKKNYIFSKTK